MPEAHDARCAPSTGWILIAMGTVGLIITIGVGALFGLSAEGVLFGRDLAVVPFIATDYVLLGCGVWLLIRAKAGRKRDML